MPSEDRTGKVIQETMQRYSLAENQALEKDFAGRDLLPTRTTKKLAFLVAAYKREATIDQLKVISDQPAGIVRALRRDGFEFQDDGRPNPNYQYTNPNGETCRKIIGYSPPSLPLQRWTKELVAKSIAAAVSSIEIYNKPDFHYREETFSLLLVNAWELLAKARILQKSGGKLRSICVEDAKGQLKKGRSGNPLTLELLSASRKLVADEDMDFKCKANLDLLTEIRDNAVHFINKGLDFAKRIQEIGAAGLRNYVSASSEWFGIDLSRYNFYLMPMTFHPPAELVSSAPKLNHRMQNLVNHLLEVEAKCPPDENALYSVALSIETKFTRSSSVAAVDVRWTNKEDAPAVRMTEENRIQRLFPLTHRDVVSRCRSKYGNFKQNQRFNDIMKSVEDSEQHGERYCTLRYLDPFNKKSGVKKYYSPEIFKVLNTKYTPRRQEPQEGRKR